MKIEIKLTDGSQYVINNVKHITYYFDTNMILLNTVSDQPNDGSDFFNLEYVKYVREIK